MVEGCSEPVFVVGVELPVGVDVLAAGVELPAAELVELVEELPEDPQPPASATAAQAISIAVTRFMAEGTLA